MYKLNGQLAIIINHLTFTGKIPAGYKAGSIKKIWKVAENQETCQIFCILVLREKYRCFVPNEEAVSPEITRTRWLFSVSAIATRLHLWKICKAGTIILNIKNKHICEEHLLPHHNKQTN